MQHKDKVFEIDKSDPRKITLLYQSNKEVSWSTMSTNGQAVISDGSVIKVIGSEKLSSIHSAIVPVPSPSVFTVSTNGDLFAVADFDELYLIKSDSITDVSVRVLLPAVAIIAFSEDNKYLAAGTKTGTIYVYQISDGCVIFEDKMVQDYRRDAGGILALAFSHGGQVVASGSPVQSETWFPPSSENIVRLWLVDKAFPASTSDVAETAFSSSVAGKLFYDLVHPSLVSAILFSDRDEYIITASSDKNVRIWKFGPDLFGASVIDSKSMLVNVISFPVVPMSMCFSADYSHLAMGMGDGHVYFWNEALLPNLHPTPSGILSGQRGKIHSLQFHESGKLILSMSSNKTLALYNLQNPEDIRIIKGQQGCFISNRDSIASITSDGVLAFKSVGYYGELFRGLHVALSSMNIETVRVQLWNSDISRRTRYLRNGRSFDLFESLHSEGYNYPDSAINRLLKDVPEISFQLTNYSQIDENSTNMLSQAILQKDRRVTERIVSLLIDHASLGRKLDDGDHYTEGLVVGRLFPAIAKNFPSLAYQLLEGYILDVTPAAGLLGPGHRVNIATDSIYYEKEDLPHTSVNKNCEKSYEYYHPVTAKTILIPEVANLAYWRSQNILDPLAVLAEHKMTDAFALPVVRAMLSYRWARVKKWFFLQFFLYLLFLGSSTAFSLHLATDDVSLSLSEFYSTDSAKTSLAFGFIALIINTWFIMGELREMRTLKWGYLKDEWNFFDVCGHSMIICVAILHGVRAKEQFPVAAVTIIIIWFKMLSYFRGFRGAGVFTRLVLRILYEIRYFLMVWSVVLLGFANAYIIIFQGDNDAYYTDPTGDLRVRNLGTAFITMFRGSTGGGLDLVWRGDTIYPNGALEVDGAFPIGNSQLYNLQLFLFVVFTLCCNVLLLNLLIALMSSIFVSISEKAAAQYRLDKTRLMIGLEDMFLHNRQQTQSPRWLHVVAPKEDRVWDKEGTGVEQLKDQIHDTFKTMACQLDELKQRSINTDTRSDTTVAQLKSQIHELNAETNHKLNRLDDMISKLAESRQHVRAKCKC